MALSFPAAWLVRPQEKSRPSPTQTTTVLTYPNTTDGLRQLLQDMLAAAKNGEIEKLSGFAKDMKIPNCEVWLRKMFDAEKADRGMASCDPQNLSSKEKSLAELFLRLAKREGSIVIRKVNDQPQPAYSRDWFWLQAIRSPLDTYDATWEAQDRPENFPRESIGSGYFLFIDGGFRWESDPQFVAPKIGTNFVPPKLITQVQPVYPPAIESQHIGGTVRLEFVVGADGAVYNPHALTGNGLSDDPSLIKAAKDAVLQWRYQPATLEGKPIQAAGMLATVTFASKN